MSFEKLKNLENLEVIKLYGNIVKELRNRKIIRTKNVIGDLGERLAIDYYTNNSELANLKDAPISEESIDAISESGKGYSIKSLTGNTTGVFYGLPPKDSNEPIQQKFEYLIIVKFNDDYELDKILELTWEQFLKYKKWHSTMTAWNITLSKKLIDESTVIFDSHSP